MCRSINNLRIDNATKLFYDDSLCGSRFDSSLLGPDAVEDECGDEKAKKNSDNTITDVNRFFRCCLNLSQQVTPWRKFSRKFFHGRVSADAIGELCCLRFPLFWGNIAPSSNFSPHGISGGGAFFCNLLGRRIGRISSQGCSCICLRITGFSSLRILRNATSTGLGSDFRHVTHNGI
jgi:hypothetical protein